MKFTDYPLILDNKIIHELNRNKPFHHFNEKCLDISVIVFFPESVPSTQLTATDTYYASKIEISDISFNPTDNYDTPKIKIAAMLSSLLDTYITPQNNILEASSNSVDI